MTIDNGEWWRQLCSQAAVEKDPKKLLAIVEEINRVFEEQERLRTSKLPSSPPMKSAETQQDEKVSKSA